MDILRPFCRMKGCVFWINSGQAERIFNGLSWLDIGKADMVIAA